MMCESWLALAGVAIGYVMGALLWRAFGVEQAFARWRLRVWDRRLAQYRAEWQRHLQATVTTYLDGVNTDLFWERLVTQAMAKQTKWRRKLSDPSGRSGS